MGIQEGAHIYISGLLGGSFAAGVICSIIGYLINRAVRDMDHKIDTMQASVNSCNKSIQVVSKDLNVFKEHVPQEYSTKRNVDRLEDKFEKNLERINDKLDQILIKMTG